MKKNNPMFIKEYKQKLKDIVSSLEYKEKMSEIVFKRWKSKKYRKKISKIYLEKGIKYTDEQLGKKRSYYRKVFKYTKKSIEIHPEVMGDKIRGIGKNFYQLDHIYSIAEGFKNNIDPKMIGSIVNIQPLPCKENLLKKDSCWITLDELKRRYRTYENNF